MVLELYLQWCGDLQCFYNAAIELGYMEKQA